MQNRNFGQAQGCEGDAVLSGNNSRHTIIDTKVSIPETRDASAPAQLASQEGRKRGYLGGRISQ